MQHLFGHLANGLQQGEGHLRADDCCGLEQVLVLGREPVDARGQHRLHRRLHLDGGHGLRQAIGTRLADERPGFHQRPHTLLQKEGIALSASNQQLGERYQARVVPYKGLQEFIGTGGWQRIKPQLRVGGFTAPGVLILRPVVDQEQEPGGRQALDQAVEQGLGFGIDPVQILKHQQQRLHLAFAQQ